MKQIKYFIVTTLVASTALLGGCSLNENQQNTLGGAAIGAVGGAIIGGMSGHAGTGAAIGAAGGAVAGSLMTK